jgi:hypothetical protein
VILANIEVPERSKALTQSSKRSFPTLDCIYPFGIGLHMACGSTCHASRKDDYGSATA